MKLQAVNCCPLRGSIIAVSGGDTKGRRAPVLTGFFCYIQARRDTARILIRKAVPARGRPFFVPVNTNHDTAEIRMMTRQSLSLLFMAAILVACQGGRPEPADLVLTNGYVYTVDDTRSVAEAVAVRGDEIIYVGTGDGVSGYVGDATEVHT